MAAYYNEIDTFAAQWLRELIKAGLIADGEVDERSIEDVRAADLERFTQCHFFAGIGGWSYALRLAGWPDDRPVWTGSCPCQPFSAAGTQTGGDDPRHLWPAWFQLLRECRPDVVFGEQVEAAINHGWLDLVCDDLEREGYAVGAVGAPACSVGAFHIRQRLWFVADTCRERRQQIAGSASGDEISHGRRSQGDHLAASHGEGNGLADRDRSGRDRLPASRLHERRQGTGGNESTAQNIDGAQRDDVDGCGESDELANCDRGRRQQRHAEQRPVSEPRTRIHRGASWHAGHADESGAVDGLGDSVGAGLERLERHGDHGHESGRLRAGAAGSVAAASGNGFWSDVEWIPCRDGKARPAQPGIFPLASGIPNRVGTLRGAGNAIVPQVAAAFIQAYCEARGDVR